jgi:hypothetical protein
MLCRSCCGCVSAWKHEKRDSTSQCYAPSRPCGPETWNRLCQRNGLCRATESFQCGRAAGLSRIADYLGRSRPHSWGLLVRFQEAREMARREHELWFARSGDRGSSIPVSLLGGCAVHLNNWDRWPISARWVARPLRVPHSFAQRRVGRDKALFRLRNRLGRWPSASLRFVVDVPCAPHRNLSRAPPTVPHVCAMGLGANVG